MTDFRHHFITSSYWRELSPISQTCYQHIWSPISVTNIDVTVIMFRLLETELSRVSLCLRTSWLWYRWDKILWYWLGIHNWILEVVTSPALIKSNMTGNEWTPVKDIMGNIRTLVDNNLDENWQSKSLSIYSRLIQNSVYSARLELKREIMLQNESPKYPLVQMLSDVSGLSGFILGISVIQLGLICCNFIQVRYLDWLLIIEKFSVE